MYVNDTETILSEYMTFKHFADDVKCYSALNTYYHHSRVKEAISDLSCSTVLAILDLEPLELRRLRMELSLYYTIINNLTCLNPDE